MVTKVPDRQRASGHQEASTRITVSLADIDFPATKEELADRVGDRRIPVAEGHEMSLRDMLEHVDKPAFATLSEAQSALDARWQVYRAEVGAQAPPPSRYTAAGESGRHGRKTHD